MPDAQTSPNLGSTALKALQTHHVISIFEHWQISAPCIRLLRLTIAQVSNFDSRRRAINTRKENIVRVDIWLVDQQLLQEDESNYQPV